MLTRIPSCSWVALKQHVSHVLSVTTSRHVELKDQLMEQWLKVRPMPSLCWDHGVLGWEGGDVMDCKGKGMGSPFGHWSSLFKAGLWHESFGQYCYVSSRFLACWRRVRLQTGL